jgi:hypothetical protein
MGISASDLLVRRVLVQALIGTGYSHILCGREHQSGTLSGGFGASLIGCNPQIRIRPQKKCARPFVKAGLPRRTDPFHKKGLPSSEFRPSYAALDGLMIKICKKNQNIIFIYKPN